MMKLIDNINALYNHQPGFITSNNNTVSIKEPANADTKQIDVEKAGITFHLLEQAFYKTQPNITTDKGTVLHDSDCDGIVFYEENDEQHILGVELKSGFSGNEIRKGYSQIVYSLLKLYTLLSICNDFDFGKYTLTAYLACQPIKDAAEESRFLDNLQMKINAKEKLTIADKVIHNHIIAPQKDVQYKIKDIGLMQGALGQNISQDILKQTITFRLYTMPQLGDHQGKLMLP